MSQKTKVLFVVGGLHRAGAERFAFEIDQALDKSKFELSVLCLEKAKDIPSNFGERYYEKKHKELGTSVKYFDEFINPLSTQQRRLRYRILKKFFSYDFKQFLEKNIEQYLNQFDVIHWMGEYTYLHFLPAYIRSKSLIQPMSAKFQNRDIYREFNFEVQYNFCSLFLEDELAYEFEEFKNYHYIVIPLVLKINPKLNQWKFNSEIPKRIGVFTRLNRYKPLDPFFYSFQLLLDKYPDCELHIFGAGNPESEGMIDILERLGIQDKVFFRGHQEDIVQCAITEKISVSWFQGYNNSRPSGYAGLDICSSGTPLICWDFHPEPKMEFQTVYPHYKNLNKFVNKTIEILINKNEAENLSNLQVQDILDNKNVENFIGILENEYLRIKNLTYAP